MSPLPKRRWLRFSISTLLVAVTIFCVWLSWQVSIVRERQNILRLIKDKGGWHSVFERYSRPSEPGMYQVSIVRRLLGDKTTPRIDLIRGETDTRLLDRIDAAFPESDIRIWYGRQENIHRKLR